jgi:hypothetical protein
LNSTEQKEFTSKEKKVDITDGGHDKNHANKKKSFKVLIPERDGPWA